VTLIRLQQEKRNSLCKLEKAITEGMSTAELCELLLTYDSWNESPVEDIKNSLRSYLCDEDVAYENTFPKHDLIIELEKFRRSQSLTPTQMAKRFGVLYQNYNNWVARGSLPKHHYAEAFSILKERCNKSVDHI